MGGEPRARAMRSSEKPPPSGFVADNGSTQGAGTVAVELNGGEIAGQCPGQVVSVAHAWSSSTANERPWCSIPGSSNTLKAARWSKRPGTAPADTAYPFPA